MTIRVNRKRRAARKVRMKNIARRMGHLGLGIGAMALLAGGGWWLNQALSVRIWSVRGVPEQLETAIDQTLTAMQPLDFVHARPARLRRLLLARLPDLADANIARRLPDRLDITASKRIPVAVWQSGGGRIFLVDGRAAPYRKLRKGEHPDLPLLRMSEPDLKEAVRLLLTLKQQNSEGYAHLSEWISEGRAWRLNFERGQSWLLPHNNDAGQRLTGLFALMQKKRWHGGDWRIDARLSGRWFVRKSKPGGVI